MITDTFAVPTGEPETCAELRYAMLSEMYEMRRMLAEIAGVDVPCYPYAMDDEPEYTESVIDELSEMLKDRVLAVIARREMPYWTGRLARLMEVR